MLSKNMSPGFHLGTSAGCLKLGPVRWGWWLMGLVPPLQTLEVSTAMVHPDDGTGGVVFPTAPWKALGSPCGLDCWQGLMPPECCWT